MDNLHMRLLQKEKGNLPSFSLRSFILPSLGKTICTKIFGWSLIFFAPTLLSADDRFDAMNHRELQETGICKLDGAERKALNEWLYRETPSRLDQDRPLSISINMDGGSFLQLSDRSIYEVMAGNRIYASAWITPAEVKLSASQDPSYPTLITNLHTGTAVHAKPVATMGLVNSPIQEPQAQETAPSPHSKQSVNPNRGGK